MSDIKNSRLTADIKRYGLAELNADLIGIANIERFSNAPLRMSPQGILPTTRSVIVMAVHHTDAAIEIGGIKHPQEIGPYRLQYQMNSRLDEMSYRMALWLERKGFAAVGIVSSNIWRYKGYKDLDAHFAADVSHMHAAVAAGLAEFGYNGLAITPEYGARQRYVTIMTDAELVPSGLLEPGSVCDNCMLCAKHCMSGALTKELDGFKEVAIEDKLYKYANKNLWRCAWGEHFDLDLDLPKPEHIDEAVIIEQVKLHGLRGGEMGSCLRYCVPREKRYFDRDYTNAPRRRRTAVDKAATLDRGVLAELEVIARRWGLDYVAAIGGDQLTAAGIDAAGSLPDAVDAVSFALKSVVEPADSGRVVAASDASYTAYRISGAEQYRLAQAAYDAARLIQSRGYSALCQPTLDESLVAGVIAERVDCDAGNLLSSTVLFSGCVGDSQWCANLTQPQKLEGEPLKSLLADISAENDEVLFGVASSGAAAGLADAVRSHFDGKDYILAEDKTIRFHATDMKTEPQKVQIHQPSDYLADACSVIVVGVAVPQTAVDIAARTPAEAIGPHTFAYYESLNRLCCIAGQLAGALRQMGYSAKIAMDLCGTGSLTASPRGLLSDMFCNRLAAVAGGLGVIGKGGFVVTREFGANVRFISVVTNADIAADSPLGDASLIDSCGDCQSCVSACQSSAHGDMVELNFGGIDQSFYAIDRMRCDWAKRYSLIADEGCRYTGWDLNIPAPEKIDAETLKKAVNQQDTILKHRPCNFELCMMSCPYVRDQDKVAGVAVTS